MAPKELEREPQGYTGTVSRLSKQAERIDVRAEPLPETPYQLLAMWEQIKARAVEDPRVAADPIPETPDLLPGLWEQIRANANELQSKDE